MAATIEFQQAAGRVYFDGGLTEDGKIIRKSKTYRNIKENAPADELVQSTGATWSAFNFAVHRSGYRGNIEFD